MNYQELESLERELDYVNERNENTLIDHSVLQLPHVFHQLFLPDKRLNCLTRLEIMFYTNPDLILYYAEFGLIRKLKLIIYDNLENPERNFQHAYKSLLVLQVIAESKYFNLLIYHQCVPLLINLMEIRDNPLISIRTMIILHTLLQNDIINIYITKFPKFISNIYELITSSYDQVKTQTYYLLQFIFKHQTRIKYFFILKKLLTNYKSSNVVERYLTIDLFTKISHHKEIIHFLFDYQGFDIFLRNPTNILNILFLKIMRIDIFKIQMMEYLLNTKTIEIENLYSGEFFLRIGVHLSCYSPERFIHHIFFQTMYNNIPNTQSSHRFQWSMAIILNNCFRYLNAKKITEILPFFMYHSADIELLVIRLLCHKNLDTLEIDRELFCKLSDMLKEPIISRIGEIKHERNILGNTLKETELSTDVINIITFYVVGLESR